MRLKFLFNEKEYKYCTLTNNKDWKAKPDKIVGRICCRTRSLFNFFRFFFVEKFTVN